MDCPACQTGNQPGQKYCGACGQKLEATCPQCGEQNPPVYKFCGQCGSGLAMVGAVTLARSGLMTEIDQKALDLLGYHLTEMKGRPFSLFVDPDDLVIFFSHWNELLSQGHPRQCELALTTKDAKRIYVSLALAVAPSTEGDWETFNLELNEVTQKRLQADQMQKKEDLLGLVFTISDSINTASKKHLDRSIEDALKKICLFAKADRCFIYSVNRRLKRIVPAYQWRQPVSDAQGDIPEPTSVPFTMIKRAIVRLRKEQTYVISDVSKLAPSERYELTAWHKADLGAFVCHLIYSEKRPIGIIGLVKFAACEQWDKECVALVKFFAQLVSTRLPFAKHDKDTVNRLRSSTGPENRNRRYNDSPAGNVIDIKEKRPMDHHRHDRISERTATLQGNGHQQVHQDLSRPMLLEKLVGRQAGDQQPVFPRDDGLVLLTCPRCSLQESVSIDQFSRLGNAVSVNCSCDKYFSAVLEQRRAIRKKMNLDGFFTLKDDQGPADAQGNIWGPMVVRDLSKTGIRFSSLRADLVHTGDILMVRFNLDNANQSLINKPARVVSVSRSKNEVGCRFEGADEYDITLGFYFI